MEAQERTYSVVAVLWIAFAIWAFIFVSPLYMILRELVGPGREVFNWLMALLPFVLLGGIFTSWIVKRRRDNPRSPA
jgi:hypothetical protein